MTKNQFTLALKRASKVVSGEYQGLSLADALKITDTLIYGHDPIFEISFRTQEINLISSIK